MHRPTSNKRVGNDETTKSAHLLLITSCAEGSGIAMWTLDVDGSAWYCLVINTISIGTRR